MDSKPCDTGSLADGVRDAAARGDWNRALQLTDELARRNPPDNLHDLSDYRERLAAALVAARASRAALASTLGRVRVVQSFHAGSYPLARQNFGESPDS